MTNSIDLKAFKIYLPDRDRKSFYIHGDLRNLLGSDYQSYCIKKIRKAIQELNLKPQPTYNYSEVHSGIQSKNPATIFLIVKKLKELAVDQTFLSLDEIELNSLQDNLINWKAPKPQKWKIGDIFSVGLRDKTFAYGQIIGKFPTVCLFNIKSEGIEFNLLDRTSILTILHITPNDFNNWTYKIIGNYKLLANKDSGVTGSDKISIGHNSFSSNVLQTVCDYHWFGVSKWEKPSEIEKLILKK